VCVLVAKGEACMGPVTRTGCGAICPSMGRACYSCYGPAENINTNAMFKRLQGLGLTKREVKQRFLFINSASPEFHEACIECKQDVIDLDVIDPGTK
jgi:coenzyme F420-reducing hydrogenase gamma subunit